MSKKAKIILIAVGLVILGLNLVPLKRGVALHCYSGMLDYHTKQEKVGLPLAYLKANRTGADCFAVVNGRDATNQDPQRYNEYFFTPINMLIDLLLWSGVIFILYRVIKNYGEKI